MNQLLVLPKMKGSAEEKKGSKAEKADSKRTPDDLLDEMLQSFFTKLQIESAPQNLKQEFYELNFSKEQLLFLMQAEISKYQKELPCSGAQFLEKIARRKDHSVKKIGIFTATAAEATAVQTSFELSQLFQNVHPNEYSITTKKCLFKFLLFKLSAPGAITTALEVSKYIKQHDLKEVIMVGMCAGFKQDVSLGSVIAVNKTFFYDHGTIVGNSDETVRWVTPEYFVPSNSANELFHYISKIQKIHTVGALNRVVCKPVTEEEASQIIQDFLYASKQECSTSKEWLKKLANLAPKLAPDAKSPSPEIWDIKHNLRIEDSTIIEILQKYPGALSGKNEKFQLFMQEKIAAVSYFDLESLRTSKVQCGAMGTGTNSRQDELQLHGTSISRSFLEARQQIKDTIAIDMEAASVARAAADCQVNWAVVKGVADFADSAKSEKWQQYASLAAVSVVLRAIEEFVKGKN